MRILRMPSNSLGVVVMNLPMLRRSSCCSTAWMTSWGKHLWYRMFLIPWGEIGFSITSSSCPNTPMVTYGKAYVGQVKERETVVQNTFLPIF